jgi:serine protease Do
MPGTVSRGLSCLAVGGVLTVLGAAPAAAAEEGPPPADPRERAAALVEPTLVELTAEWEGRVIDERGQPFNGGRTYAATTYCSGFVVDAAGYVATSANCLAGWKRTAATVDMLYLAVGEAMADGRYGTVTKDVLTDYAITNWRVEGAAPGSVLEPEVSVTSGASSTGAKFTGSVPARIVEQRGYDDGDLALLKIEQTGLSTLPLAPQGAPDGVTDVFVAGLLESDGPPEPAVEPTRVTTSFKESGKGFLEIGTALPEGTLGGPTVDPNGNVVGVNSALVDVHPLDSKAVSSADTLRGMLADNGVAGTPGPVDAPYRKALADYYAGEYGEALDGFEAVLTTAPDHAQARSYRDLADQRYDGPSVLLIAVAVAGGLALVGLVATAIVLGTKRRRPPMPPPGGPFGPMVPQQRAPVDTAQPTAHIPRAPQAGHGGWPGQAGQHAGYGPPGTGAVTLGVPQQPPAAHVGTVAAGTGVCPRCARPALEGARFCPDCGVPVS